MDVNIIIRSEVSQKEKEVPHDITYMWNLKCNTNEHICETETDSQRTELWLLRGVGEGRFRVWD